MGWRKTTSASRRSTAVMTAPRTRTEFRNRSERRTLPGVRKRDKVEPSQALVASTAVMRTDRGTTIAKKQWQEEAWSQYRSAGEAWYAIEWLANAISRVRLKAGRVVDGGDEPEIMEDGPVAEIVEALAGGVGGRAALLKSFTVKLMVPGDSYLVGYEDDLGIAHWNVYSVDVVRKEMSGTFSIRVDESTWMPLPVESLVVRIWNPDEQFPWQAVSPMMPALSVLREIDLYNRKIITQLTARLASNGILLIPDEAAFPVREEFSDAADPLVSELIDVASKAIQNPGSAAAALPIPLRMPGELIEKLRHMTFADNVMEETLDGRDRALKRLATMLNVPPEVLSGMGSTNHWTAAQIEAQAIKVNVAPVVETICRGLTEGYLLPALADAGLAGYDPVAAQGLEVDGARYVVWYDASELAEKPDYSERAVQLHDRVAISDAALRRATGFDDSDAPTEEERNTQILTRLSYNGQQAVNSYEMLTGTPVPDPVAVPGQPGTNLPVPGPGIGLPDQKSSPPQGPTNGGPPSTVADNPPQNVSTIQEIPRREGLTDEFDIVLTPRYGSVRERVR